MVKDYSISTANDFYNEYAEQNNSAENILNNNATLRRRVYEQIDRDVLPVGQDLLNGIADLQSSGLAMMIDDAGKALTTYEKVSAMTKADISMHPEAMGEEDRITFDSETIPIPIIHKAWRLNMRQLSLPSNTLSLESARAANMVISEALEDMLFNGIDTITASGKKVYGYTTHPDRNIIQLSGNGWQDIGSSNVIDDTKKMLDLAYNANYRGNGRGFYMYVSTKGTWNNLQLDYNNNKSSDTYRQRIEAFSEINMVKASSKLAAGNVVLVQMSSNVVDLAIVKPISNVQWSSNPLVTKFMAYAMMVPRVKSDIEKQSGIVHGGPNG